MDRLLNISDPAGYPLCAETLELLHNNVQLLETVLNGLNLPQHTIVRFPYGNFAYVQSNPSTSGRGEILEIATGANLANGDVHSYAIASESHSIEDSHEHIYSGVYETRRLNLSSAANTIAVSLGQIVKCYNFDEILEKAFWRTLTFYRYGLKYNNADANYTSTSLQIVDSSPAPILIAKYKVNELRFRICLKVTGLPIAADSEFRLAFKWPDSDSIPDVFPIHACFNGNDNDINHGIDCDVTRGSVGNTVVACVKIPTSKLYGICADDLFTGQITVNGVISLDN